MSSLMYFKIILFAIIGAYASVLANKAIAVYHDGLRPIMPEFLNGHMKRRELAAIAFAISIGFITGFAMPITLATGIMVIHIILLAADIIGCFFSSSIVAGAVGAIYGGVVTVALDAIIKSFKYLPVNFLDGLSAVGDPIIYAFVAFPALAVAYQFGKKKGIITFVISLAARILVDRINPVKISGNDITLSPEGMAMFAGMICLIVIAAMDKSRGSSETDGLFNQNVKRIKKNVFYIMGIGALLAVAANFHWLAGEPIADALLGKGKITSAAIVAFVSAIGFLPLIVTTSLVSGVYATEGWCDWILGFGYIATNPFLAAIFGAGAMGFEIFSLGSIGKLLNKFPALKNSGDNIRTAMTQILEVALLVGGMNAGNIIWPGAGYFIVASLYILNEIAGRPIMRLAAGPFAAIIVGILVNIAAWVGLYIPPVVK